MRGLVPTSTSTVSLADSSRRRSTPAITAHARSASWLEPERRPRSVSLFFLFCFATANFLFAEIIQLRGPRTKEELQKLWLLSSGRVTLPENWDRIGENWDAQPADQARFMQGLVRLPKFLTPNERKENVKTAPFGVADSALRVNQFAALNPIDGAGNRWNSPAMDSQTYQFGVQNLGFPGGAAAAAPAAAAASAPAPAAN